MHKLVLPALLLAAAAQAQATPPAGPSFEGQIIYQVLPDRFFDGDPSNNAGVVRSDLRAWHGGDLAGLTQKLPYIQKLGATAVWLTPIYRQQAARSSTRRPTTATGPPISAPWTHISARWRPSTPS